MIWPFGWILGAICPNKPIYLVGPYVVSENYEMDIYSKMSRPSPCHVQVYLSRPSIFRPRKIPNFGSRKKNYFWIVWATIFGKHAKNGPLSYNFKINLKEKYFEWYIGTFLRRDFDIYIGKCHFHVNILHVFMLSMVYYGYTRRSTTSILVVASVPYTEISHLHYALLPVYS